MLKWLLAELIFSCNESTFLDIHVSTSKSINSFENAFLIIEDILSCTIEFCLIHRAPRLWNRLVNQVASYLNWLRWKCWSDTEATCGMFIFVLLEIFWFTIGTTRFTFANKWQFPGMNSSTSSSSTSFEMI